MKVINIYLFLVDIPCTGNIHCELVASRFFEGWKIATVESLALSQVFCTRNCCRITYILALEACLYFLFNSWSFSAFFGVCLLLVFDLALLSASWSSALFLDVCLFLVLRFLSVGVTGSFVFCHVYTAMTRTNKICSTIFCALPCSLLCLASLKVLRLLASGILTLLTLLASALSIGVWFYFNFRTFSWKELPALEELFNMSNKWAFFLLVAMAAIWLATLRLTSLWKQYCFSWCNLFRL